MTPEIQHTLAKSAGFSGTSMHTGEQVTLKLQPAPVDVPGEPPDEPDPFHVNRSACNRNMRSYLKGSQAVIK